MRSLRWWRLWGSGWALMIVTVIVLSLIPPPPLAVQTPENSDKLAHFLAYAVLAAGGVQLFERGRILLGIGFFLVMLGIGMEVAQGVLMPGVRMPDPWDALANSLGVLAGLLTGLTPLARLLQRVEAHLGLGNQRER